MSKNTLKQLLHHSFSKSYFLTKLCMIVIVISIFHIQTSSSVYGCYRLVWCDYNTNLALGGVDPVGYFTEGTMTQGVAENEYEWRGAVWRFKNVGNMIAFIENPDSFAPQFGGFDPLAISEGKKTKARAQNWVIIKGKLYLFYSQQRKNKAFLRKEHILPQARDFWEKTILKNI